MHLTPRQSQLFDALLSSFLTKGFADFTIDSATRELHCSKSTIYTLGKTRDDIVRRVVVTFFKEVARRTDAQLSGKQPRAALETYFSAMASSLEPASPAFMRDLSRVPVAQAIYQTNTEAATRKINELISKGIEQGEFRHTSAEFLAEIISGAMQHIQTGTLPLPTPQAYRELGELVIRGIAR